MIRIQRRKFKIAAQVCYIELMREVLRENLARVIERIESAAQKAMRDAREIKLIAVSKTHPSEIIKEALRSGAKIFGENKVREAEGKILEIGRENAEWHLIGHLQSNKARKAVQLFDVIHTLDSVELATRLERISIEENRESLDVLVQVDLAGEETKSGISENDLPELVEFLKSCARIKLKGFMILPPFFDEAERARPFFTRLREIRNRLLPGGELSMGMSHDFEIAIEEGATMVRVGTAIFGEREYND
jgi:pyridoxal phosphate enzyme (YggS family)